jgi:hypothetical protein
LHAAAQTSQSFSTAALARLHWDVLGVPHTVRRWAIAERTSSEHPLVLAKAGMAEAEAASRVILRSNLKGM